MNARSFQAHRTQLCNVPGCDCSCPNCRVPPLPTFGIQRSTRGAPPPDYYDLSRHDWPFVLVIAVVFVAVFVGPALGWW